MKAAAIEPARKGHCDYQLLWKACVIELLQQPPRAL